MGSLRVINSDTIWLGPDQVLFGAPGGSLGDFRHDLSGQTICVDQRIPKICKGAKMQGKNAIQACNAGFQGNRQAQKAIQGGKLLRSITAGSAANLIFVDFEGWI